MLPFFVVGAVSIFLSLLLVITIPDLTHANDDEVQPLIQDPTEVQLR